MSLTSLRNHCAKCSTTIDVDFLPSLPCGHLFCMNCVEHVAQEQNRTWSLPCPREGCEMTFSIPAQTDPHCLPRPAVQPPIVPDPYAANVSNRAVIAKPEGGAKVMGMTLLGDALYVVSSARYFYEYHVIDSASITGPQNHLIPELKWPRGVAACERLGTLYITDWQRMFGGSLWRYCARNDSHRGNPMKVNFDIQPFGVSVYECDENDVTILVTVATPGVTNEKIIVFKDDSTTLQRTATLTMPSSFQTPRHSLRMPTGEYLVCHGWTKMYQHRVSKLKLDDDKLIELEAYGTYGGSDKQQLRCPLSMCADDSSMVFVVDYYNHRVQLLTPHLQLVRHIVTQENNIYYPRHACIDSKRGVLLVGLQNGEVHVFQVRN